MTPSEPGSPAKLAALASCYVGDGFGALHRKHASVYDVPALLPHAAGELVLKEIETLRSLTETPERPYVVVLGGAKPSDKLAVIANLLDKIDRLIIVGGMSYTFLAAKGYEVGQSLLERDQIDNVRQIMADAERKGLEIVLPVDLVGATGFAPDAAHEVYPGRRLSRPTGRAWTWAPAPGSCSRPSWPTPRRCSGMARPGYSSSRLSRRAPGHWPRRSATCTG